MAVCDEMMLEEYLEKGTVGEEMISRAVAARKIFPCWFGSALRAEGIAELLDGIAELSPCPAYGNDLGAKVYKISRDSQGNRLTWLKVTGGLLKVKEALPDVPGKINQIRIYSGEKYELVREAQAGTVFAVTGLEATHPGQGVGW